MFYIQRFVPFGFFSIRRYVPFGVFFHSTFRTVDVSYYSTFCPSRRFFPFDVLSQSAFSIRRFVPFGVLSSDVLFFDVFYRRRFSLQHFVVEPGLCVLTPRRSSPPPFGSRTGDVISGLDQWQTRRETLKDKHLSNSYCIHFFSSFFLFHCIRFGGRSSVN